MREIKFKYVFSDGKNFRSTVLTLENTEDGALKSYVNAIPSSFKLIATCQFTGVEDKNSVEIYNGDILREYRLEYDFEPTSIVSEVMQLPCGSWYAEKGTNDSIYDCINYQDKHFEVIGNIYEDKELLL